MNKKLKTALTIFSLGVGGSAIYILPLLNMFFMNSKWKL